MTQTASPLPEAHVTARQRWATAMALALPVVTWMASLAHQKVLSADGVYYLQQIAESRWFHLPSWGRHFAQYVTEWPAVLVSRLDGVSLTSLAVAYSVGLLLPVLLSFGLLYRWLGARPELLIFPVASFFIVNAGATHLIIGEHHVLTLLIWPVLAFCLFPRDGWIDRVVFLALVFVAMRCYESAIATHLVPLSIASWRAYRSDRSSTRLFWIVAALGLAEGIVIGGVGIVFPRSADNRGSFISALTYVHRSGFLRIWVPCVAGAGLALLLRRSEPLVAGVVGSAALTIYYGLSGYELTSYLGFASRTFSLLVSPPLMALMAAASVLRPVDTALRSRILMATCVVCLLSVVHASYEEQDWTRHLRAFREYVETPRGIVSVADTPLGTEQAWGWTYALMSVVLSGDCVSTIVYSGGEGWVPFDPRESFVLERYRRYGPAVGGPGCE